MKETKQPIVLIINGEVAVVVQDAELDKEVYKRAQEQSMQIALAESTAESHNRPMTEKEIVLETIRALPDDCSLEEIAERVEFMAAVQKGLDQLDRGESIPHDEVKKQLASWLIS